MQPSQKERAISAVHCKKEGMLLQPLGWRCVGGAIHHERQAKHLIESQRLVLKKLNRYEKNKVNRFEH